MHHDHTGFLKKTKQGMGFPRLQSGHSAIVWALNSSLSLHWLPFARIFSAARKFRTIRGGARSPWGCCLTTAILGFLDCCNPKLPFYVQWSHWTSKTSSALELNLVDSKQCQQVLLAVRTKLFSLTLYLFLKWDCRTLGSLFQAWISWFQREN